MVRGLGVFRERFLGFEDRYVLIGGTASEIALETMGVRFRTTRDLDVVVCVEALDQAFARVFWSFVTEGGYEFREASTGLPRFYRFHSPADARFPHMIELFSRTPGDLIVPAGCHLTPIPVAEEVSSLSAILLDEAYYGFVMAGARRVDGLSVLGPAHIVALKARAWIDLSDRRARGTRVQSGDIRKHRNDIIRLSQVIPSELQIDAPAAIRADVAAFLGAALSEGAQPADLGMPGTTLAEVAGLLRGVFDLE